MEGSLQVASRGKGPRLGGQLQLGSFRWRAGGLEGFEGLTMGRVRFGWLEALQVSRVA